MKVLGLGQISPRSLYDRDLVNTTAVLSFRNGVLPRLMRMRGWRCRWPTEITEWVGDVGRYHIIIHRPSEHLPNLSLICAPSVWQCLRLYG